MYKLRKIRNSFMALGLLVVILSLVGLFSFGVLNFTTIHPVIYGFGIIIGSECFLTAYISE